MHCSVHNRDQISDKEGICMVLNIIGIRLVIRKKYL